MTELNNKIDFCIIFTVKNANPNGDPLNGNRPRLDYEGHGEITDVCLKRKIRNRMIDDGKSIFVQSDDKNVDGIGSLKERFENFKKDKKGLDQDQLAKAACQEWMDVRSFGQLFALKGDGSKGDKGDGSKGDKGVSIGIRGPVSIQSAFSVDQVSVTSVQITKSTSSEKTSDGNRSSDTMGMKHRIDRGTYVTYGSINANLAEKTGFSEEDAECLKEYLCTMFENDASSARPEGTMAVKRVYWWKHNCKSGQYSSARVHNTIKLTVKDGVQDPGLFEDYDITETNLEGLEPEVLGPF